MSGSQEWLEYFERNALEEFDVPWERGADVTADELASIAASLQAWQLGETSDGNHLREVARRHAEAIGDPDYPAVVDFFIREEQRHGEMLGRFLDLAGAGRVQSNWGDTLFRFARYFLTNIETWTTPVLYVESLAMIYYNAIRLATKSVVLRAICSRILADEIPHLHFQCERLAIVSRRRSEPLFEFTMMLQKLGFACVVMLVWFGHRKAFKTGGYRFRRYWRTAWTRLNSCRRIIRSSRAELRAEALIRR